MNKSGFNFRKIITEAESISNNEKASAFVSIDKYIKDRSSRLDFQFNNSLDNSFNNESKSKNQFFEDNDNSTVNIEEIEAFVSEINLLIDEEISEESVVIQEENSKEIVSNEAVIEIEDSTIVSEENTLEEISEEAELTNVDDANTIEEELKEELTSVSEIASEEEILREEVPSIVSEENTLEELLEEADLTNVDEVNTIEEEFKEELISVIEIASEVEVLKEEIPTIVEENTLEELSEEVESTILVQDNTIEEELKEELTSVSEIALEDVLKEEVPTIISEENTLEELSEEAESTNLDEVNTIEEELKEELTSVSEIASEEEVLKEELPTIVSEENTLEELLEEAELTNVDEVNTIEPLEINDFVNHKDLIKSEPEVESDEVESLNKQAFDLGDLIQKEDFLSIFEVGNTLILPRLGAFTVTNQKTGELFFMPYLKHDDNVLNNYISKRDGISIDEAKKQISSYVDSIKYTLDNDNQFIFSDFGRLFYDNNKELTFDKNYSKDTLIDTYGNKNNTYQDTNINVEVNEIYSQIVVDDIELITENTAINISENKPENTIENTIHPTEDVVENISEISTENSTEKYIVETPTETISNNKENEIIEELDVDSESTNYEDLENSIFNDLNSENNNPEIVQTELQDSFNQKNSSTSKIKKGVPVALVSASLILALSIFFFLKTKENEGNVPKKSEIISEKQINKSIKKKNKTKDVKTEETVVSEVKEKKQSVENISATQNIQKNEDDFNNTSKVNAKVTVTQQTNVVKTKNTILAPVVKKNPIGLNNNIQPKSSLNTKMENVSLLTTNKLNSKNINFDSLKISPTVRNMIESGYYDVFVEDKQIILKTKSR